MSSGFRGNCRNAVRDGVPYADRTRRCHAVRETSCERRGGHRRSAPSLGYDLLTEWRYPGYGTPRPFAACQRGQAPEHADIRITQDPGSEVELVINLKAAKQMGLTIPDSVLFRADRVIK